MEKEAEQSGISNFRKILYAVIFFSLTIIFILPYLIQISIYFHEKAHHDTLSNLGIKSSLEVDWTRTILNFYSKIGKAESLGVTKFNFNDIKALNPIQIKEFYTAGIISDLKFLLLLSIYLIFINLFVLFKKPGERKNNYITLILMIDWIIFMWILVLVSLTLSNISYSNGDLSALTRLLIG